jgi:hypothetical protein
MLYVIVSSASLQGWREFLILLLAVDSEIRQRSHEAIEALLHSLCMPMTIKTKMDGE